MSTPSTTITGLLEQATHYQQCARSAVITGVTNPLMWLDEIQEHIDKALTLLRETKDEKDHGASLLPGDPPASPPTTETLPEDDACVCDGGACRRCQTLSVIKTLTPTLS